MCACACASLYVCMCACVRVCVCACVRARVCVRMCVTGGGGRGDPCATVEVAMSTPRTGDSGKLVGLQFECNSSGVAGHHTQVAVGG